MKSLVAKLLLVVYLFSYTPLREMIKMPLLVTHYLYHAAAKPETTVRHFFEMHYGDGVAHDADFQHEHQLPFKTSDSNKTPVFVFLSPKSADIVFFSSELKKMEEYLVDINTKLPDAKLRGIFHPPQSA